ncbi:Uncharacterized protein APZ42_026165 [Daphnia magna]|uniref:MULE transposase domain-containing protein n=1 Tax=Daphnia magna TaxID=35525 RepID=A0A164SFN7_9CRUS|nr:Uncharacterized protein APZ42_026165 [Daphnia magna]
MVLTSPNLLKQWLNHEHHHNHEIMPLPRVDRIVTDFERAVFVAVRKLFPSCFHLGCNFHWCQAIMKKIIDNYDMSFVSDDEM